ncbi:hypothetical protein [Corynebacterium comes]|uniref:PEP-CTERM protein-sorting domain-containing protein n=1 Tax=Corynebacterium comes TaxID=2675218 RepID=A0A6B8W2N3_9CORY|nr:hypothetical protein [Corynebacterium comes]QGU03900.1 hypothetical protein CETAM_03100 [Corynebacterium comes]
MSSDPDPGRERRRALQHETLLGFLGFFAFLALVQAVGNLFAPEPALWPGVLAGVLVGLTWWVWRRG